MTLIQSRDLGVGYDGNLVARSLNLSVAPGELIALLGPNGAGKTTTINTLAGIIPQISGTVLIDGEATRAPLHLRARKGLAIVTEQRSVITGLTVEANLQVGKCDVGLALAMFPELDRLRRRRGGLLSGGEQQMLALARALSRKPRLVLADEISLGLAPLIVNRLHAALRTAADAGAGVLVVEQHSALALKIADRAYVLSHGAVHFDGPVHELRENPQVLRKAYLAAN